MTIARAVRALEARITDKEIEHPSLISSFLHKLIGSTDKPGLRRGGCHAAAASCGSGQKLPYTLLFIVTSLMRVLTPFLFVQILQNLLNNSVKTNFESCQNSIFAALLNLMYFSFFPFFLSNFDISNDISLL